MCVAVPMEVAAIEGDMARVARAGVSLDVSLALVEGARVGDYVIVHAGFAIQLLSPEEARETLALFAEIEGA